MKEGMRFLLFLAVLMFSVNAFATPVVDGVFDKNEWQGNYTNEDGKVGPGSGGQDYDVEYLGLYFNDTSVTFGLQTGFDLVNGRFSGNTYFKPGDLVIDVNGDKNYDYAIDFSFTIDSVKYKLIDMTTDDTSWEGVHYSGHIAAHPLAAVYTDDNVILDTGADVAFSRNNADGKGYNNSDILEGSFALDLLTAYNGGDMTIKWTMGCGNDYIEHSSSPVPEPATMLLLGTGLIGFAGVRRKFFK